MSTTLYPVASTEMNLSCGSFSIVSALNGRVQLVYRGRQLQWCRLPAGAARTAVPVKAPPTQPLKTKAEKAPAANHPWRRLGVAAGRRYWHGVQAQGGKARAVRLGVRDAGRPSLRTPAGETDQPTTNNEGDILS